MISDDKNATVSENNKSANYNSSIWFFWRARRYVVILFIFFGMANMYALRTNMSIAIVAMTRYQNVTLENGTQILHQEFNWDTVLQGYILSAFFYGYLIAQVISGYLSVRISAKVIFATGLGLASILTIATPWLAQVNVYLFLVIRFTTGLTEGMIPSSLHQIWTKWTPFLERNRLVNFSISGSYFGMVISLVLSSLVASAFGWESIFYLFGTLGLIWTILWIFLTSNSPAEDTRITAEELKFITESTKLVNTNEKIKTPWKSLFTSSAVWGIIVAAGCEYWGFNTLLTQLPKFMNYILNYNFSKAGFMSSLPYILLFIILQVSGHVADYIQKKNCISVTNLRKIYCAIGFIFQSVFLMLAVHLLTPTASTFCFLVALGFGGISLSAMSVNTLDLTPRFGSILLGIMNLFATAPGIISPIITGYIVTDEKNVYQWRIIFYIAASLYFFGFLFYAVFGSAELQPWDNPNNHESNENKT